LRIISGTARGRRLFTPPKVKGVSEIRPTADRVREAIFNILTGRFVNGTVLDLFAGTGALGLEALSRGSDRAIFVDFNSAASRLIKKNLEACGFSDRAKLLKRDLLKNLSFLRKIRPVEGFRLIFVDPPYRRKISGKIIKQLGELAILSDDGLLVVEEASEVELPDEAGALRMIDHRVYGDTAIFFYENAKVEKEHE